MIYLQLFYEYFKTGLLSFGGGYATLPFLYHISETYHWYNIKQLSDMIAVSSITPGPVGVNMATYSGYTTTGILGAFVATTSIILPSLLIVIAISKFLEKFKENKYVKTAVYTLKPTGCGLLAAVVINLLRENIVSYGTLILFIILLIMSLKIKKNPLIYLGISAFAGILLGYMSLL